MAKSWYAAYGNFDDDALATLASAGLLRRAAKDVEAGKVGWLEPPQANGGRVSADGRTVRLGADGPQHAKCDCPAPGICKHVLAAALWLRNLPDVQDEHAATSAPPVSSDNAVMLTDANAGGSDVLSEVLAIDPETLFKSAGRATVRQAAGLLSRAGEATVTMQVGSLLVAFTKPAYPCRYIGGIGFAGMVSEAPSAMRPALHLAAVLAIWRQQGRSFNWPDGIESAIKEEDNDSLIESERQFLQQVRQILYELCGTGLSHVSDILHGQLRAINMSARSERLPRLAGMLRTLAGTVELLAKRDYHADERQAIALVARIHALCAALDHANNATLPILRGRLRRDFGNSDNLDLLPLGAYWWESRSGARGLTVSFWESRTRRIMQAVLARPDSSDPGFDRNGAWLRQSLWKGVGSAERACEGGLQLNSPRLSDDGRIALGGEALATPGEPWRTEDPRWSGAGFDDWSALADVVRRSAGLTGDPVDCVLLRPQSTRPPRLDEVRQTVDWIVTDRHGANLLLQLPCEDQYRKRIENLERLVADGADIQGVVARLDRGIRTGSLEPVALLVQNGKFLRSISLDFTSETGKRPLILAGRILRLLKSRRAPSLTSSPSFAMRALTPILDLVEYKMMTGRLQPDDVQRDLLQRERDVIRSVGIDLVAQAIDRYLATPNPDHALRLVHLCITCLELDASFLQG